MAQHIGKVVWFNNAKGYGFLAREDGSDIFCHYSAIQVSGYKALRENQPVEFDTATGPTGRLQADNVKLLEF